MAHRSILYYISSHGYGHARRAAEVVRAIGALLPAVNVYVRTAGPAGLFTGLIARPSVPNEIDVPVIERDPLSIDWNMTLEGAAGLLRRRRAVVASEVDAVRALGPSLVVADVPFLAGDVATALGVPCVAISNFTWDWIYESSSSRHPDGAAIVRSVRSSYAKMDALLQLPFGHDTSLFSQVIPVPLVVRRATREPREVLRQLGLEEADGRQRVLVGMRGGVEPRILEIAARAAGEFLFLRFDGSDTAPPEGRNIRSVRLERSMDFSDLLAVSDVVVSKLGYGMIADCIAAKTRLVWPPREGFREDEVTRVQAPLYLRMAKMPAKQFRAGEWAEALRRATSLPQSPERMLLDGAEACARYLAGRLG